MLRAGVAAADVTPPVGIWHLGKRSERIRDDLRATALVLEADGRRVAFATVDLLSMSRESTAAIRAGVATATGIPADHTLVVAAHTHSGPLTEALGRQEPDGDYVRVLERKVVGAIAMAAQRLVPAELSFGEGRVGFNVNRRLRTPAGVQMLPNPAGPVDRRVRVLRVDAVAGEREVPLAVLFSESVCLTGRRGVG